MPGATDGRLYLVRHGQTTLNAQDRLRGLADPPLDDVGMDQARAVADALAPRGVVAVYASPLVRAIATARVIGERLDVPAASDARLNDRDYGPWTGHVRSEVVARFGSVDDAPGVEPVEAVLARARPALDALRDAHPDGAVAVVTHDAVIRPLLQDVDRDVPDPNVATGSWSELRRSDGRWSIVSVGNVP